MRELLNDLYRECSRTSGITPNQSHALAEAASVLGSVGVPTTMVRGAWQSLRAAFENSPATAN